MEDFKKSQENEKEIVFSRTVKAGKRIYYVDVKRNKKGELFLALTESKKIVSNEEESPSVNFEKHKIFLYHEDFDKFMTSLGEAIDFIKREQPGIEPRPAQAYHETEEETAHNLNIDLDLDDLHLSDK